MQKQTRLCVGLLSGTSVDAVEAVLCRVKGSGSATELSVLEHLSQPFERELTSRVVKADSAKELCQLNFILGERFAQAALDVISKAKLTPDEVDVIGSHGQTMAHWPMGNSSAHPSTLQMGEAAIIAERTGVPTVCDFRTRDMAAGGQGAPLVPYFDWAVLRRPGVTRAFLNVGGIANVSAVSDSLDDTIAFDTGPGNMLMDALAQKATDGKSSCDMDGRLSAQGQLISELLDELLTHRFLSQAPPKSTGRENFGEILAGKMWERYRQRPYDLMATAVAFTVETVARALEKWILPRGPLEAVYVSGGGSRNPTLFQALGARLSPLAVLPLSAIGFPEAAKEAACFALLASEFLSGVPQNVPSATGARKAVILGKMVP